MAAPTSYPGNHVLPALARATFDAARALGFGDDYAYRAAAGAVLGAAGSDRSAPDAAERGKVACVRVGSPDRWADFVAGVLGKDAS